MPQLQPFDATRQTGDLLAQVDMPSAGMRGVADRRHRALADRLHPLFERVEAQAVTGHRQPRLFPHRLDLLETSRFLVLLRAK